MKYREVGPPGGLPPSVAVWLDRELLDRGILSCRVSLLALINEKLTALSQARQTSSQLLSSNTTSKFSRTVGCHLKSCNFEEFRKEVVASCPQEDINIESLVDELCKKLNALNSFAGGCLKEKKTNSEDIFNLELPVGSPSKFCSVLPNQSRENWCLGTSPLIENPTWAKSICRVLGGRSRTESSAVGVFKESSNKITKRREGKENAKSCTSSSTIGNSSSSLLARMRSRSTVKGSSGGGGGAGGGGGRARMTAAAAAAAKSLDRSGSGAEKSAAPSAVVGGGGLTLPPGGKKCLFGGESGNLHEDYQIWRLPSREDEQLANLPMDFQSLLQSPDDESDWDHLRRNRKEVSAEYLRNFISSGTNITSSIWSTEKMDEDESLPWEEVGKYVGWSEARNSLLSSSWKLPFAYGTNNNNILGYSLEQNTAGGVGAVVGGGEGEEGRPPTAAEAKGSQADVETTALDLKSGGSFFSLFNEGKGESTAGGVGAVVGGGGGEEGRPPTAAEAKGSQADVETTALDLKSGGSFFSLFNEGKGESTAGGGGAVVGGVGAEVGGGGGEEGRPPTAAEAKGSQADVETTALDLKSGGSFFSLFNEGKGESTAGGGGAVVGGGGGEEGRPPTAAEAKGSNHLSLLSGVGRGDAPPSVRVETQESEGSLAPSAAAPAASSTTDQPLDNLLTSMKTHFKPIQQEALQLSAASYNDGSSFINVNCFEEVKYRRSESGSLFLEPDVRYMEFKRSDVISTGSPPAGGGGGGSTTFVPKFKVCSNEKFCQTDEIPTSLPELCPQLSSELPPPPQNSESEFFFPGDDRYAAEEVTETPRIELSGWVTTWPVAPATASDDIWSNDTRQSWVVNEESWSRLRGCGGEGEEGCGGGGGGGEAGEEGGPYRGGVVGGERRQAAAEQSRLRREITQEGEQLLSDIRFLLQGRRPQNSVIIGSSGL